MKLYYLLSLIFLFIFIACKKEDTVKTDIPKTSNDLQGKWELRGMYGQISISYDPGNGNELQFGNGSYIKATKNEQQKTGKYYIVKDASVEQSVGLVIPKGKFEKRIVFDDKETQKMFFEISNDTLHILQGFFPTDYGSQSTYVRVN